ncbi:MAG: plasmid partition protein ParG [Nitrospira sp.]
MTKKVPFGTKPAPAVTTDQWVESRTRDTGGERTKRLTIDVPLSLHVRIKAQCALRGTKMADEIRALLEERFPSGGPHGG